jgi:glycosyltransferase involved in cell wall biosynthesis
MLRRSRVHFTSPSKTMIAAVHGEAEVEHIPNFVELDRFPFAASVPENAPIVMMGRIDEQKGVHVGIEAARRAGQKLIIAGTVDSGSVRYFEEKVKPHIDNEHVRYVGPVDDRQKAQLLGAAAAFLLPAQWEEPFGIVMLEAMSCGTPVIGLKRGEIPEIIAHGKTGFIANDVDEIVRQLDMVRGIDRQECRLAVEQKYSSDAIVDRYVDYFRTVLRSGRSPVMDESLPSRRPF